MTIGRLTGDAIVSRLGFIRLVALGCICASVGTLVSLVLDSWQASLLGYARIRAGCSNIVPVLVTAAGRQQHIPRRTAIPAIISMGYAGMLMGLAFIGMVAHTSTLVVTLGGLVLVLLFVSYAARFMPDAVLNVARTCPPPDNCRHRKPTSPMM
ncbi:MULTISPECIES: hypothetical protein [unclassified Pseudomonas]|uniref:hypothetical protein n=1 Tax=unclassified Pseudomonas TaxID=196821 RepID=UPI003531BE75